MFGTGYGPPCRTLHAARSTGQLWVEVHHQHWLVQRRISNVVGVGRWCFSNLGESSIFLLLAGLAACSWIRDTVDTLMGGGEEFFFPDLVESDSSHSPSPASTHRIGLPPFPTAKERTKGKRKSSPGIPGSRIEDRGFTFTAQSRRLSCWQTVPVPCEPHL
jgi:hypothetical protein